MASIIHQINIKAPAHDIYELIVNKNGIKKWLPEYEGWQITGDEAQGSVLTFFYGEHSHEMIIFLLNPDKEIKWKCIAGHPDWVGTTITFAIQNKGEVSILNFSQTGWTKKTSWYEMCNALWSGYMASIKNLAEWK